MAEFNQSIPVSVKIPNSEKKKNRGERVVNHQLYQSNNTVDAYYVEMDQKKRFKDSIKN